MINAPVPPTLTRTGIKLMPGAGGYGAGIAFPDEMTIDEARMSVVIPYASGVNRDGVGDLLEVGGIDFSRHTQNPIHLFDHGKNVTLPLGKVQDPETGQYTGSVDLLAKTANDLVFFYQGKGLAGTDRTIEKDHALFCEQVFDLLVKKFIRAGSIGYQVIQAQPLPADSSTGTPAGLHLLRVLKLESSTVVLPANADTVRKLLALPSVCGKALSPWLVKSLQPYAPEPAVMTNGGIGSREKALPDGPYVSKWTANPHFLIQTHRNGQIVFAVVPEGTQAQQASLIYPNRSEAIAWLRDNGFALGSNTKGAPVPLGNLPDKQIPPSRWKPGAGAIKAVRMKYRKKGFKFDRGNLSSAIEAAKKTAAKNGQTVFVHATAYGYTIEKSKLPRAFHQDQWQVDSSGSVTEIKSDLPGEKALTREDYDKYVVVEAVANPGRGKLPYRLIDKMSGQTIAQGKTADDPWLQEMRENYYRRNGVKGMGTAAKGFFRSRTVNKRTEMPWQADIEEFIADDGSKQYAWFARSRETGKEEQKHGFPTPDEALSDFLRFAQATKSMQKSIKSIRVKYRNKLVKGYANVELKFDTSKLTTDQLDAFAKDMMQAGFGKPSGGRWTEGENAKLLSPMKKSCFTADLEPGKAVHEALAKAHAVAAKHGAKWLGNAAESKAEPQPMQASQPNNGAKSIKTKAIPEDYTSGRLPYPSESQMKLAYAEGFDAGLAGNPGNMNRYAAGSPTHEKWKEGYAAGRKMKDGMEGNKSLKARGGKTMAAKTKTISKYRKKAADEMPPEEAPPVDGELPPDDPDTAVDEGSEEKLGAQVLRKIHEHHLILMADYDEALDKLENESVKTHLQSILEDIEAKLQETEDLFADEYPDSEPLEGAGEGGDSDEADEADSGEEDLPPPDEVVEGMEENDGDGEGEKSLRGKRFKGTTRYVRKHISHRKKACPACGMGGEANGDVMPNIDATMPPDDAPIEKSFVKQLTQDDVGIIGGSSGFLREASEYSGDWGDEMRTKAGGWHKQLDPLGLSEAGQGETPVPVDPESEAGPVDDAGTMEVPADMQMKTAKPDATKALAEVFTKQAADIAALTKQTEQLQKVLAGTGTNGNGRH